MKKLLLILFIGLSIPAFAQDEDFEKEKVRMVLPNATVKLNIPVLLLDPKHAFFVSTDTRLAPNWSLDMGVGYYFFMNNRAYYENESFRGFRGRMGIKYYYVFGKRLAPYVGLEGMLNRFNLEEHAEVWRFGRQYMEEMVVDREVKSNGVAARTGLMVFMGEKQRFFFDVYAGIGYKFMEISLDLPSDGEIIEDNGFFNNLFDSDPGEYYIPNIILGIHFGYAFW